MTLFNIWEFDQIFLFLDKLGNFSPVAFENNLGEFLVSSRVRNLGNEIPIVSSKMRIYSQTHILRPLSNSTTLIFKS